MVVFSRDATTGELSFVETLFDDLDGVDGIRGAWSLALSPDGEDVYVAGRDDDAVAVFNRDTATGTLAFLEAHFDGLGGVDGLARAVSVAVSPDGAHVFATGLLDDALTLFRRDPMTGALDFLEAHFDGMDAVDGLDSPGGLAVSPDGAHVYATSLLDDAVAVFAVLGLDPFMCYKAKTAKGQPKFVAVDVTLEGQFESKLMTVKKPELLCPPTQANGEAISDPNTHLQGYKLKLAQTAPPQAKESVQTLSVVNRFGEITVITRKADRLLVPSSKDLVLPPDPNAHAVDHYKCYRVKETGASFARGTLVSLEDSVGQAAAFELRKPVRLCLAADKNGEGIKSGHAHLMCYSAKRASKRCDGGALENPGAACSEESDCGGTQGVTSFCEKQGKFQKVSGVQLNNQFGPGVVDLRRESELCVPSAVH